MIKLFGITDKLYSSNGDLVLQPTKAKVHKEDNGDFYINLETPLSENEKSIPAIEGSTISGTSFTINNVDTNKSYELTQITGNTDETNVVSGMQTITTCGYNFINVNNITPPQYSKDNSIYLYSGEYYCYVLVSDYTTFNSFLRYSTTKNGTYTTFETTANEYGKVDQKMQYYVKKCKLTITKPCWVGIDISDNRQQTISAVITKDSTYYSSVRNDYKAGDSFEGSTYYNVLFKEYEGNTYKINLGENLFPTPYNASSTTKNGITFTILEDGSINVSGTATAKTSFLLRNRDIILDLQIGETYTVVATGVGVIDSTIWLDTYGTSSSFLGKWALTSTTNHTTAVAQEKDLKPYIAIAVENGATIDTNVKVWVYKGTYDENITYTPYKTPIELTTNQERIYKDNNEWYLDKENGSSITTTQITDQELISQLESLQLLSGVNNVSVTSGDLAGDITIHYNYREAQNSKISYIDYLVPNNIIVANTPQGDQAFRITNVENTRNKIKIKAYHVFYDSKNYLIKDTFIVDKSCNDALDQLNINTDNTSPFTTISDITKIASYRCVRKSLYEGIQVLLERYGGHLYRDNWTLGIKNSLGQDNGVTIRYGKNLKDIKATYNWDNVCTKLLPVGKDGLLLNALDPTASVYLESQIQYEIPYTKTVSFDQSSIVEDDYKDEETGEVDTQAYTQALLDDLTQQGQNYVQTNSVPVVNYTLSANVEKVSDIGDTIQVVDEKLGINILTNIISYEYDCILDKYTQIEFGNFTPTLSGLMNSITNQAQQIVDESIATIEVTLGDELKEAQEKIWNALGSSYVIYEGDKILVVDSLPKETATNVIMINNGGIGFSNNGINGNFNSAWTIDNVLNMEQINVINLTADLIKGGTLKLGSNLNQNGQIEVYDEANSLIAQLNKNGLKMYGVDGSYILMNNTVGFSGYDRLGNQIYWVSKDEFHMKKSVVEEEITLCNKMRFIPITITDSNDNIVNDGIGLVSVAGGGN